ncbi:MAG: metallophosphoesterase family protein [Acidobacteriota bacterium]
MANRIPEDHEAKQRRAAKRAHDDATRAKLTAHRGHATWGERLVPLGDFARETQRYGRRLDADGRDAAIADYLAPRVDDATPVEGSFRTAVVFGGVYSNYFAFDAVLAEARALGAEAVYCLGDLGGFGPEPEQIFPRMTDPDAAAGGGVRLVQGNYEQSLAGGAEDCNCGYADPRDNHYAVISYGYTARNCSDGFKRWMGEQPARRRVRIGDRTLLLIHGSPRRVNEVLFDSTTPDAYLEVLCDQAQCDAVLCTHTGLAWHRRLPSGRDVVNVGVIGRPANDGQTCVWYAVVRAPADADAPLGIEIRPLVYDHAGLAEAMRREALPAPFIETILTGWWTTCLEILPARERADSRF